MSNILKKSISIIVPVYNGYDVFSELLASLENIYKSPRSNLKFIIIDDCSPDKNIPELFASRPFLKRSDVITKRNDTNLGFIGTVNHGIDLSEPESDIILLNSDTKVFSDFAQELQSVAMNGLNVGTVTPLTNSGTIASVFDFPDGGSIPSIFDATSFAATVAELAIPAPQVSAPTGVGFAMYITREMINTVGVLDPIYGKGYGEECDLCQRAKTRSFTHLIATNCFVYHKGSESFGSDTRKRLIEENAKILEKRYPSYTSEVIEYVQKNPIGLTRATLVIEHILRKMEPSKGVIHVLHSYIGAKNPGGTEKHVDWLTDLEPEQLSIVFSPNRTNNEIAVTIKYRGYRHTECLQEIQAIWLLNRYIPLLSKVHLHHTLFLSENVLNAILTSVDNLVVSIHDFHFVCPSINLLTSKQKNVFCHAEVDIQKCNNCLEKYYNLKTPIEMHRANSIKFLSRASSIIFPSENTYQYYLKVFPEIQGKCHVLNHDLTHFPPLRSWNPISKTKPLVIFLGSIGKHKGSDLTIKTANTMLSEYDVEIWGAIDDPQSLLNPKIAIRPYSTCSQLHSYFSESTPDFIVIPSIWAETFCYTFYETILMSNAIPVVSSFGNPAAVIKDHKCGVIFPELNTPSILQALKFATSNKKEIIANITSFRETIRQRESYATTYNSIAQFRHIEPTVLSNSEKLQIRDLSAAPSATTEIRKSILYSFAKRLARHNKYTYWVGIHIYKGIKRLQSHR